MNYAFQYDVFGEHKVRVENDKIERIPDSDDTLVEVSPDEYAALRDYWRYSKNIDQMGRQVPLTKSEVKALFKPRIIRGLVNKGVLKEANLWMAKLGKKKEIRACVVLTEVGRGFCRRTYEEVSSNTDGAGSASTGSVVGQGESVGSATV